MDEISGVKQSLLATVDLSDFNDQAIRRSRSISTDQIGEWATHINALRQLWLFDACNAGSLAGGVNKLISTEEFHKVQFGTGIYLAAAVRPSDFEQAHANPAVHGGFFTNVFLEGLYRQSLLHWESSTPCADGSYMLKLTHC